MVSTHSFFLHSIPEHPHKITVYHFLSFGKLLFAILVVVRIGMNSSVYSTPVSQGAVA